MEGIALGVERTDDTDNTHFIDEKQDDPFTGRTIDPLIGRVIDDKYELKSIIDKGGVGQVYLARRLRIGDLAAVKIIKISESLDPSILKRFKLEAASAAAIKHQNVVSIYDFGLLDDIAYLVMERLEGPPLSSELIAYGTCSLERTLRIFKQVAAAISAAHKQQIIHRDLKPSNIIFQRANCIDDELKVVDFGLAKLIRAENPVEKITVDNSAVGTPLYMSPEQCFGQKLDERSDIYSLGVLLYEMLTGEMPFNDSTASKVMFQHIFNAAPSMRLINPDIPEAVDAAVLKALAKSPERRYRSALEMATEFELACRRATISKKTEQMLPTRVTLSDLKALSGESGDESPTKILPAAATRMLVPFGFSFERFIGRNAELTGIKERFEQAKEGAGSALFIIGDPGVGKTELANEFQKHLKPADAILLSGKFYEYGSDGPYRTYLDSLWNFVRVFKKYSPEGWVRADDEGLAEQAERALNEIERLINSDASKAGAIEERIKYQVFERLAGVYAAVSSSPAILFLDDVHWADPLSLEFLAYLIRNTEKNRILILCNARGQDILDDAKPVKAWFGRISRYENCHQIKIGSLSEVEMRALLDSIFGSINIAESVVRRFYETTQGNPFYIGEIVRQLLQEHKIVWCGERWECADIADIDLPGSILELVELRLKRLSDETLDVLTRAAVAGEKFSFRLLRAISELPKDALMEVIDTGLRHFIIKESTVSLKEPKAQERFSDDTFIFCHSTLRKVLYDRLSSYRRCRLHAQIAGKLENLYARNLDSAATELAYHFYYGDNHGKALYYSAAAGEKARNIFAVEEAAKYFSWAEDSLEEMSEAGEEHEFGKEWIGDFRLSYGSVLMHLGKNEASRKQLETALKLSMEGGFEKLEGKALHALGELSWYCGAYKEAVEYCESALKLVRHYEDSSRECRLLSLIGDIYFSQGQIDQAIEFFSRSLELSRKTADRAGEGEALRGMGSTMGLRGQAQSALDFLDQALAAARAIGNRQSEWLVLMIIGNIHLEQNDLTRAAEFYRRSLAVARSIGRRRGEGRVSLNMGELCRCSGDCNAAKSYLNDALIVAAEIQDLEMESHALANLGLAHEELAEFDSALKYFQKASDMFQKTNYRSNVEIEAAAGTGRILLLRGEPLEAKRYFESAAASGRELGLSDLAVSSLRGAAACEKALDKPIAATVHLREALNIIKTQIGSKSSEQERRRYSQIKLELIGEIELIRGTKEGDENE